MLLYHIPDLLCHLRYRNWFGAKHLFQSFRAPLKINGHFL